MRDATPTDVVTITNPLSVGPPDSGFISHPSYPYGPGKYHKMSQPATVLMLNSVSGDIVQLVIQSTGPEYNAKSCP